MKLNCKKGERAIIIKGSKDVGRIVVVSRLFKDGDLVTASDGVDYTWVAKEPTWVLREGYTVCESEEHGRHVMAKVALDSRLRPLRDSDEDDETLTWAGKPQEVTA